MNLEGLSFGDPAGDESGLDFRSPLGRWIALDSFLITDMMRSVLCNYWANGMG